MNRLLAGQAVQGGGPQLPSFIRAKKLPALQCRHGIDSYSELLNRLRGELGFRNQQTALRWLLEQLETSHDLRHLILVLLQEGDC